MDRYVVLVDCGLDDIINKVVIVGLNTFELLHQFVYLSLSFFCL